MDVLTANSERLALAVGICDDGDLAALALHWPNHPPCLWVSLAATSPSSETLRWILQYKPYEERIIVGFANELAARVAAGCLDRAVNRGASRLRAWRSESEL